MGNCYSASTEQLDPISAEERVKVFTVADLKKATKDFSKEMVKGERFGSHVRGYINPKTLSPAKEGVGMAIAVKRFYMFKDLDQDLQDWVEFNARISYFGLKNLPYCEEGTHVPSLDYAPPEYILSGKLEMSGDVYSFGSILLQMLTGLKTRHVILEIRNDRESIAEMIDPDLENSYPFEEGMRMCEIIKQCLEEDPKNRPSMQQVLDSLNAIART